jgi:hypothetical protein
MRSRWVFRTLLPGMATVQKGPLHEFGFAYEITVNGIQKPVEHGCILPMMFQSFTFPSCKSGDSV